MTQIGPKYDSANSRDVCLYCNTRINDGRVIIGTGNSLLAIYHLLCWEIIVAGLEIKDPSPASTTEEG